jgi:hypothetical protein
MACALCQPGATVDGLIEKRMTDNNLLIVGWREWIRLPDLDLPPVKAKVDTGARTSCLHAFSIRPFTENGQQRVEFQIHPKQFNTELVVTCTADVLDRRTVTDSGGHKEDRWVIQTPLSIGEHQWPIEITLSARDDMRFRMLLGRNAIKRFALVDSSRSYVIGKRLKKPKSSP